MSFFQLMKDYASNKTNEELQAFLLTKLNELDENENGAWLFSFLDTIPYPSIVFESEYLLDKITDYWLQDTERKKAPERQIESDLKTVEKFLKLIERYGKNNNLTRTFQSDLVQHEEDNVPSYAFVKCLLHDLLVMGKDTEQSNLYALRKNTYYKNTVTKESIEKIIREFGKKYSITIDYADIRPVIAKI